MRKRWSALFGDERALCPNCGAGVIRQLAIGDTEKRVGFAILWCPECRTGIRLSRVMVPLGMPMLHWDDAAAAMAADALDTLLLVDDA